MSALRLALRHMRVRGFVNIAGRLAGLGLFFALIYSYCHVLVETCFRGLH